MNRKLLLVICGVLVVTGFSAGIWGYKNKQQEARTKLAQESNSVFNRPHSPIYGAPTARVRIVEFFDPACETCRAFYPMVKKLVDEQQGKVQLVVRYAAFHKGSDEAVKILEAARLQSMFFPVTEAVLRGQPQWADHGRPRPELIWGMVDGIGLNIRKAKEDAARPEAQAVLDQDMADARTLNVTQTPGFFVNGRPLTDFGFPQLKALVLEEVKQAYPQ